MQMEQNAVSRDRLVSLDVLRGLAVMGMILVNSAAGLHYGQHAEVYGTLLHVSWDGLSLADSVFPAFLMMVGVAIPMSFGTDGGSRADAKSVNRVLARALRLFLLGFFLSNINWFADMDAGSWRLWGVLQRIGLVYGACALLFLALGPKARMQVVVAILLLYWLVLLLPSLDGLPNDPWMRGHTFAASVDRWLLGGGGHNYVQGVEGYDPEGLLSTLPAIAHGLVGVAVGEYLRRRRGASAARRLIFVGAAALATGLVWSTVSPIVKDMWSGTFVLVTCGLTIVALAILHLLLDYRDETLQFPWTVATDFGTNAIAAYVLHMVTGSLLGWDLLLATYGAASSVMSSQSAALLPIVLYMFLIWLAMAWLRRRRWVVRI